MSDSTTPISGPRSKHGEYPPEVAAFFPLLLALWEDGVLSDEELSVLRTHVDRAEDLSSEAREALAAWMDPKRPPDTSTFQTWKRLSAAAAQNDPALPDSLSGLGRRIVGEDNPTQAGQETLRILEKELGVLGAEAVRAVTHVPAAATPDAGQDVARANLFSREHLAAYLVGDHAARRAELLGLFASAPFQNAPVHDHAAYREWVRDRLVDLAQRGYGRIAFPSEFGGDGDTRAFMSAFETIALHDLSLVVKYGVQFGLFGGSIQHLGSEEQKAALLPAIGSADLLGCFAMTETGHGSNVRDIETTAEYDVANGHFTINTPSPHARKDYIGNAARHGRTASVFAQLITEGRSLGVHAFLVPVRDESGNPLPGISIQDCGAKMGLNGVDNGRFIFSDVVVPRSSLLSRFGKVDEDGLYHSEIPSDGKRFFTMLGTLVGGRISVGLGALSAAKVGLTIAVRYGNQRRQFGPRGLAEVPIMDYLTHRRKLYPLIATTYGLHFALHRLADDYQRAGSDDERQRIETRASGLKAFGTAHTTQALQVCREACGGQGYLWENRIAGLKADTDVFTTFEGDNTVLKLQVAKSLLGEYGDQFSSLDVIGYVKHFARLAGESVKGMNPIVARMTDEDHLRNPEFIDEALRFRAESLLRSVARRMKHRIDNGVDSFDAFIECQDHLVALAEAHTEHAVFSDFRTGVTQAPADAQQALTHLMTLYGLFTIEQRRGWYLEQNYMEAAKTKAIRKQVNSLLDELRSDVAPLVEAWDIPDHIVRAPISTQR